MLMIKYIFVLGSNIYVIYVFWEFFLSEDEEWFSVSKGGFIFVLFFS